MVNPVTAATITLSEFPDGTVNPTYTFDNLLADNKPLKVAFKGEIVDDGADPTSPAIAFNTTYQGPVVINFNSPVSAISFDAGAFNNLNSTRIVIEGRNGFKVTQVLNSVDNTTYEHFSFDFHENAITRVRFLPVGQEDAGFAVDNISVSLRPESKDAQLANDLNIDNLISGTRWNGNDITYSFTGAGSKFPGYGTDPTTFGQSDVRVATAAPLSANQQFGVKKALFDWAGVADINFTRVNNDVDSPAMMRFGVADITAPADGGLPGQNPEAGDVWFQTGKLLGPTPGSYDFETLLHEVGHALGLKHPHDDGLGPKLPGDKDSLEYSVMSYRSYPDMPLDLPYPNAANSYPQSLMMNDIAAIQHLYGANFNTHKGNDVYRFDPAQSKIFETIWDGGGIDRYDLSGYATDLKIDLNPGKFSVFATDQLAILKNNAPIIRASGNVYNARLYHNDPRSLIEDAKGGSGNDKIVGNQAENTLHGRGGNDVLDSLGQHDRLFGDDGRDWLYGGSANDQLIGGLGRDQLTGGTGDDNFIFTSTSDSPAGEDARDVILDFIQGDDEIVLAPIDADIAAAGLQHFQFIGTHQFTGAGQLRFVTSGQDTIISGNTNANPFAELQIQIHGALTLTLNDFVF